MKAILPKELHRLLVDQPDLSVIDVRTELEFDDVHVKQARNIPLDSLSSKEFAGSGGQPVYILCRSGQRAAKAAEQFAKEGFEYAVVVEGGTLAWIAAGLPVVEGAGRSISLERQVRIAAGTLVLTGVLLGNFVNPLFYGLSGFVGAGLIFAGITDWCGMGLLIAKAPWNKRRPA
ncbi:MAG: rhodanese-like domain-containing protein [Verrucomicrobiota bacterium]